MKKLYVLFMLIFLSSFATAVPVYYNMDSGDDYVYKETISFRHYDYEDYKNVGRYGHSYKESAYVENSKRHPVSDYKDGYSYRSSEGRYDRDWKNNYDRDKDYDDRGYKYEDSSSSKQNKDYYTIYVPYLKKYETHSCYNSPPSNKIF